MKDRGFILNTRDYSRWTKSKNIKQVCRDEKKIKKDGWIDNLDSRALSRLILKVHVERLKQEQGKTKITVRELSKYMNLGVQTLYRTYGRDILRAALYSTVNDHYLTSKTQVGQAKEAIASKGFRLPPSNQDVDRPLPK